MTKHGIEVLRDPSLNKSTAFTEEEKQALGIVGLVPDVTESEDLQLTRVMMQLGTAAAMHMLDGKVSFDDCAMLT